MARSRNIKPAFFNNDELADIEPLGRLLFIGMWTIADFKGDLEWREKRIKAQILPYDNCDVKKIAINLDKSGFIRFYSDGNKVYLNISNFTKHQNPHKNERDKGSEIPEFKESMRQAIDLINITINRDKSGLKREGSTCNRADSLIPITDSLIPITDSLSDQKQQSAKANPSFDLFKYWCDVMGKSISTSKLTPKRDKAIKARLKEGYTFEQIKAAIDGCRNDPFSMGQNDRQKAFNDIELICRNGEKLESFLEGHVAKQGDINSIGTDFSAPEDWYNGE